MPNTIGTVHTLNVHKTFRGRPGRLLNILCTFNLRPVNTRKVFQCFQGVEKGCIRNKWVNDFSETLFKYSQTTKVKLFAKIDND